MSLELQRLEQRLLFAFTPANALTIPVRQTLLNDLNVSIKSTLQADLNANNANGFDQDLLNYMIAQPTHFFWQLADASSIASYITSNIGDGGASTRANEILAHKFPQQSSSEDYTIQLGSTINWTAANSSNPEFLHALNRQAYWNDLSDAYQYTGNTAYVTELVNQLASWSQAYQTMALPTTWSAADQGAWLLDMGVRTQAWAWSYNQVLGSTPWTGAANTLFLYKEDQQAQYMNTATSYGFTDNRSVDHAEGLLFTADAFPQFSAATTWQSTARTLLFNCIDTQFYTDGTQDEESPGYAGDLLSQILDSKLLDQDDGHATAWTSQINAKVQSAVDAYYEELTPDGKRPALNDTYRISAVSLFLEANLVEGMDLPAAKPRGNDVWHFGTATVNPFINNPSNPALTDRGATDALTNSGVYIMRSGSDANARQIEFTVGPKGGQHGHFDDLSFELFGYGAPLISNPGPFEYDNSAQRAWAISTPAQNTLSIDGLNESDMEGVNNPGFAVDQYDAESDHVQITAHDYGYSYLAGGPVVSRSIYYDLDGTMLIVDWMDSAEAHTASQSFLLPGTSVSSDLADGSIESTNASGGNVKIQSLLQSGQTASTKQSGIFTSSNPPPNESNPATQFLISQTGKFVAFATLVTAYDGTTAPNTSAQLLNAPTLGGVVRIALTKNGVTQDISFTPPNIEMGSNAHTHGQYASMAYDSQGNLHLAYYDDATNDLKYSVLDTSGNWSPVQTIDNNFESGFDPSLAINSKGQVGIAYTDALHGDLKYAFFDGTNWTVQTVDAKGSTGHYPSLAFSRTGGPAITYYDHTNGDLRLATSADTPSGWALSTIDSGTLGDKDVGRFSKLVLDPTRTNASKWAIAYEDDGAGKIMYAVQGSIGGGVQKNGYTFFTISDITKPGGYTSLAFDPLNRPVISFYDTGITGVRVSQSSGTTLTGVAFTTSIVNQVGTVGSYSQIYFTSAGVESLLYFDRVHNELLRSVFSKSKWTTTVVATGGREIELAQFGKTVAVTDLDTSVPSLRVVFI